MKNKQQAIETAEISISNILADRWFRKPMAAEVRKPLETELADWLENLKTTPDLQFKGHLGEMPFSPDYIIRKLSPEIRGLLPKYTLNARDYERNGWNNWVPAM